MRRRWLLPLMLIFGLCSFLAAQTGRPTGQPNSLTVTVKVTTGSNLPGLARVELARGEMPMEERFADGRGQYTFRGLQDGEYTVTVNPYPSTTAAMKATFFVRNRFGVLNCSSSSNAAPLP